MPSIAAAELEGLSERDQAFYAALQGEDDLGVIVRAHIHIEHELHEFIKLSAPKADQIKFSDYDYDGLLKLALVLGFDPALKSGPVRDRHFAKQVAHRLEMKFAEQEAKKSLRGDGINSQRSLPEGLSKGDDQNGQDRCAPVKSKIYLQRISLSCALYQCALA